jgi:hypothetical protein
MTFDIQTILLRKERTEHFKNRKQLTFIKDLRYFTFQIIDMLDNNIKFETSNILKTKNIALYYENFVFRRDKYGYWYINVGIFVNFGKLSIFQISNLQK